MRIDGLRDALGAEFARWQLAWRHALRNRRRVRVTVLIASVGTASLMISGGFMNHTYTTLREAAARDHGHLSLARPEALEQDEETPLAYGLDDGPALRQRLSTDGRIRQVLPRVELSGLISNGEKSVIFMGQGMDVAAEARERGPFLQLVAGHVPSAPAPAGQMPQVLMGSGLARSLDAHPGQVLTLLAATRGGAMNALDVQVAGVVVTGWEALDRRVLYMDLAGAGRLLDSRRVSRLALFLDETAQTGPVMAALAARLAGYLPTLALEPWWARASYYHAVRGLYDRIFGLLGCIIGALVFFSVVNTLGMAVVERTREIGTLRALGAQPEEVVGQFVREGGLIGMLGALLGNLVARGADVGLHWIGLEMPAPPGRSVGYPLLIELNPQLLAGSSLTVLLLCTLAAWWVSRRAARMPVVDALIHV
jgi:putative ABC transport system permease protein